MLGPTNPGMGDGQMLLTLKSDTDVGSTAGDGLILTPVDGQARHPNAVNLQMVFKYEGRMIVADRGMSSLVAKDGNTFICVLCGKTSNARNNLMSKYQ